MGWGEAVAGGLGAISGIYGANKSASSAKQLTQMQMAWERERAQNAHQWEVEDLKKAGLNPIISAGGTGATTSGISGAMPDTSGYNKAVDAINSATTLKRTNAEIENLKATTNKTNVESGLLTPQAEALIREKNSNTMLNSAKKVESQANAKYTKERTRGTSEKGLSLGKLGTFGWKD